MNDAPHAEETMPLPVPMLKEKTVKEDGRFLIYYTFPSETETPTTEDADV